MIELGDECSERLTRIENKIDSIKGMLRHLVESEEPFDPFALKSSSSCEAEESLNVVRGEAVNVYLLKLPDSLRQTMFAMDRLKEATTNQVAKETTRSRSLESIHLNQLERMGYLAKLRKGKMIYFKISRSMDGKDEKGTQCDIP